MNFTKQFKSVEYFNKYLDKTCAIILNHKSQIYSKVSKEEFESGLLKPETKKELSKHYTNYKERVDYCFTLPQMMVFVSMLRDDLDFFIKEKEAKNAKKHVESVIAYSVLDFILDFDKLYEAKKLDYKLPEFFKEEVAKLKKDYSDALNINN